MKYTPGPWVKDYGGTIGHIKSIADLSYKNGKITPTIARYDFDFHWDNKIDTPVTKENQEANAHLIAAAPDLLEACECALAGELALPDNWINASLLKILREAIAKAKGKQ